MPRRDEGASGITQRTKVQKDVWADTAGNVVDQAGNVIISAAAQALVSGDGMLVFPRATLTDCLLLGNNATVWMPPGAVITSGGTVQHTMIRTGNAEFTSDATAVPGVSIYCADEVTAAGTGTLRYTHATTSLAWLAPGATAYGPEVDISSVTNAATVGIFTIAGASAGQALYVYVAPATRSGVISRTVRVEPVTGARGVTWTRASNVRTVTETGHGRRVGDFVVNFGPAGDVSHGYITAVTANTYTFPDAGSDQGAAQAGRAYGVRNIQIIGNGATLDYNRPNLTTALMSGLHAIILHACSDVNVSNVQVNNTTKYAVLVAGYANVEVNGLTSWRTVSSDLNMNSDTLHICGPGRTIRANAIRAQAGDNILGVGCGDFMDYQLQQPNAGDLSLIGGRIADTWCDDTDQHPVRFYNANGANWIRGWVVDTVRGTYSAGTDACVAIITETVPEQIDAGATNVDGLTIIAPDAVRTDGVASAAFVNRGAGTRRGIKVERVRPRAMTSTTRSVLSVETGSSIADLTVQFEPGDWSGNLIGVTGTGTIGRLRVTAAGMLNGNNELGGGFAPNVVCVDSTTAAITNLEVAEMVVDDVSSTGTKARLVFNNATIGDISVADVRMLDGDAVVRASSTGATGGAMRMRNVTAASSFVAVFDNGAPVNVGLTDVWHSQAANAVLTVADATARTIRVRLVNVRAGHRMLRNTAGNHTWLISGYGNEPGIGAALVTDAGTPLYRLDGDWDLVTDGALLDATVANHRAGAKFYNSNAAFGAGVGGYVRGATTWVRVAA